MKDSFHIRSLHAGAVTAVDACSSRSFARHMHDEFGVGLVWGGAQRSWSGRGPVEAVRGNVITVNPAELHDGAPIGSHRSWSMLYFSQHEVSSLVADLEEGRVSMREMHAPVLDDRRLAGLFLALRKAACHPQGAQAFEERLLTLFARLFGTARMPAGLPTGQISKVRERIDDAPACPHALIDLAALAGLSRYQTVREFSRLTGLTPHAYVMLRRSDMARTLIRQGSTLAEAAVSAGFADQSHMHRVFVARHGFTPGAYAKAFRASHAISSKRAVAGLH